MSIPFNKPFIAGKELHYISQAVLNGQISGDGPFTKKCEQWLEKTFGAERVLLTTSCTSALEMAAILCGVEEGDEVIMPSFSGASTANAFMRRGAKPIFVDIRSDTLNLDDQQVEAAITERTRVIVPRHYAGVACEMDSINRVAESCGVRVVENAAEGVSARYNGRFLGTLGSLGTYSFHETKNVICGEGGALVINDDTYTERAEIIREKGTNRKQFFRGQVDKYTWVDIGSSYVPTDLLAAFLYAQLERSDDIAEKRRRDFGRYMEGLRDLENSGALRLPKVPQDCEPSYHAFYILVEDEKTRSALISHLREQGIFAVFHFVPLHTAPMGRRLGWQEGMLAITEEVSRRLLRLPMYYDMRGEDVAKVTSCVASYFKSPVRRTQPNRTGASEH